MNANCRALAVGLALAIPVAAYSQVERFDLGQRLRAFESALERQHDAAGRQRGLASVQRVTSLYFIGQSGEAARVLDRARMAVESVTEPAPEAIWAQSITVRPDALLLDVKSAALPFTVTSLYPTLKDIPSGAKLEVSIAIDKHKLAKAHETLPIKSLPMRGRIRLSRGSKLRGANFIPAEYQLFFEVKVGKNDSDNLPIRVSLVSDLNARLNRLRTGLVDLSGLPASTDIATIRTNVELLASLRDGFRPEVNIAAGKLLTDTEAALAAVQNGRVFYDSERTGQIGLTLAVDNGTKPVRLLAPKSVKTGSPLPLVIALHGAKGSENLYFEGYGNGLLAKLCEDRGWLLVAPRDGTTPDLIDAVNKLYPVDRKRVYLVGHSMGAAQAMAAVCKRPKDFAGVALFGGGGGVTPSEDLKSVAFFVGVGKEDFLLSSARGLAENLKKAGVKSVVYQELPDVEHLTIVQLALRDALNELDRATKR